MNVRLNIRSKNLCESLKFYYKYLIDNSFIIMVIMVLLLKKTSKEILVKIYEKYITQWFWYKQR